MDDTNSDNSLNVTYEAANEPTTKLGLNLLTLKPDKKSLYPDIYFKIIGLKSLDTGGFLPDLSQYDSKWVALDGDYLTEQLGGEMDASADPAESPTVAETTAAIKAVSGTVRQYFLTSDTEKAVVVNKGFIGKETVDGIATYHYKAGINKDHGKQFCKALGTTIANSDLFRKLVAEKKRSEAKQSVVTDCQDEFDDIKSSDTFDMWIDARYKLIHKIRVYDSSTSKSYVEVGQYYKGGDTVDLFANIHSPSDKTDATVKVTLNFKDYSLKGSAEAKSTDSNDPYTMSSHFSGKASDGTVNVIAPTGAIDFRDVLNQLETQSSSSRPDDSIDPCDGTNPYAGACAPDPNLRTD